MASRKIIDDQGKEANEDRETTDIKVREEAIAIRTWDLLKQKI